MTSIFGANAPAYWAAGLSAIPLRFKHKAPVLKDWEQLCQRSPTPEEQATWVELYPENNIGLAMGPASGLCAVDIDTDDPKLQKIILDIIGYSPWCRIGQKGMVFLFKHNPEIKHKWNILLEDGGKGKQLMDFLTTGTQIVLPPSIHPDTLQPYVANVELVSVLDQIPTIPSDLRDRIVHTLNLKGYKVKEGLAGKAMFTGKVAKGERDNKMIQIAGKSASAVLRGEVSVKRAINDMLGWNEQEVEKDPHDPLDIDKGLRSFLGFLVNDVTVRNKTLPIGWDEDLSEKEKKEYGLEFNVDQEVFTVERLQDYIQTTLTNDQSTATKQGIVSFTLQKLAKIDAYSVLEIDQVLNYMKNAVGEKTNVSIYKKRISELQQGAVEGLSHREIAEDFIKRYAERKGQLRYWADKFWQWNGAYWLPVINHEILSFISEEYGYLPGARKAPDHAGIYRVIGSMLFCHDLATFTVTGVNFANGFLTDNLRLVPHDPAYGKTYVLPFNYEASQHDRCHKFLAFLHDSWGHHPDCQDKIKALQEAIGVTIFGKATEFQMAFLLFGLAKTGKSQVLKIVEELMPKEAVSYIPPYDWADKFAPAQMAGKVVNICSELDEKRPIDGRIFKDIVSADVKIAAQHKNQQIFNFAPKAAHWFASNFLPRSKDTSDGFTRRWLIFSFDKIVRDDDRIVGFGEKLVEEERVSIASWAVEGYRRAAQNGHYTLSASHKETVNELGQLNDLLKAYIFGSDKVKWEGKMNEEEFYSAYYGWANLHGGSYSKVSRKDFSRNAYSILQSKGVSMQTGSDGLRWFHGISLKK